MLKNTVKFLFLLGFMLSVSQVSAASWTAPTFDPPSCPDGTQGCDIPLNVSSTSQTKAGGLIVGGLRSMLDIFITNKLGVGTFSPRTRVHLVNSQAGATTLGNSRVITVQNPSGYNNERQEIGLGYQALSGNFSQPVVIGTRVTDQSANTIGDFYIATRPVSTDTFPTERLVVTGAGNVGVGTNAPAAPLNIKRDPVGGLPAWIGQVLIEPITNSDAGLTLKSMRTGAAQLWSIIAGNGAGNANFRIYDGTAGVDLLNIAPGGNVGIGTITPASKLDVVGDICWTPAGGSRQCLGAGGGSGTDAFWTDTQQGDIRNTNTSGQVNIQGKLKIEGGTPATNKILISSNNAGLATWANPSEIPGLGLGSMIFTQFDGCTVGVGCPLVSGDSGPTSAPSPAVADGGTLRMSCPSGYKVVSGGARCRKGWSSVLFLGLSLDSTLEASYPSGVNSWDVGCSTALWSIATFGVRYFHTLEGIDKAFITCAK